MVEMEEKALAKHMLTTEELREELEKREKIENAPPDMLASEDLNISRIRQEAEDFIKSIHETGREPHDADHGFCEAVMEAFYGKDIWTWINKHNAGR